MVAGDVVGGAYPREVLELPAGRLEHLLWIRGNAEREAVAGWDGAPTSEDEADRAAAWSALALDGRWRDGLNSCPPAATFDGVSHCHGSPRRDDEVLTRVGPDAVLRDALAACRRRWSSAVTPAGRSSAKVAGAASYVECRECRNPAYEEPPEAFWLVVHDGRPQLRESGDDLDAATVALRGSGFGDVESQLAKSLLEPVDPDWVTAFFEHTAGRRSDPGLPPPR